MKLCRKCGAEKPETDFSPATWYTKDGERRTGLASECKPCFGLRNAPYYQENKERLAQRKSETNRALYLRKKDEIKARVSEYNKKHNHKWSKLRRSGISQQTPSWANKEAIKFFYECCPAGCHVDHIIPLRGKTVSGLHVETNLQWLPAAENHRKSNKF